MQIRDNKGAETSDFVGWFEEVRHHNRHHTGGRSGTNAVVGILQGQTQARCHAKPLGCFQKWIGRRFPAFVVAVPDAYLKALHEMWVIRWRSTVRWDEDVAMARGC